MATSVSYGKNGNFDPCKIETLEQIDTESVRIETVDKGEHLLQIP